MKKEDTGDAVPDLATYYQDKAKAEVTRAINERFTEHLKVVNEHFNDREMALIVATVTTLADYATKSQQLGEEVLAFMDRKGLFVENQDDTTYFTQRVLATKPTTFLSKAEVDNPILPGTISGSWRQRAVAEVIRRFDSAVTHKISKLP